MDLKDCPELRVLSRPNKLTPVKPVYAGCVAGFNQSSASTWVIYFYNFSIFLQQFLHISTKQATLFWVIHFSNIVCHSRGFLIMNFVPLTKLCTLYTWALLSLKPPALPYLTLLHLASPYLTLPQLLLDVGRGTCTSCRLQ